MEPKQFSLGSSLLVPSVQELVKDPLTKVPPRYVLPHQEPVITSNPSSVSGIPIIDMQSLISGESMEIELESLHSACKDWGFFQVVNHGVSSSLVEKIKMEIQEFFKLPMEEKKKYWQVPGESEGFGQVFVVSEEQKLDWADTFSMITLPIHTRKPHLFPKLPFSFREALDEYSFELKKLAQMGKALKMEDGEMRELFEDGMQAMRMNYYPPCPQPELVVGITPHSDSSGLTILLQIIEGLEIRKDGCWIPIKPQSNAFIVNIGDILEMITNGTYRSIEHRGMVNSAKERLSIATFYNPTLDGEIAPAPNLISLQTLALLRRIGVMEFLNGMFKRKLDEESYLDAMRI